MGERPGLVTAESMSAYLTYKPHIGIPGVQAHGDLQHPPPELPPRWRRAHIAELIKTMLEKKASGIDLR